jgi:hypothetical protein
MEVCTFQRLTITFTWTVARARYNASEYHITREQNKYKMIFNKNSLSCKNPRVQKMIWQRWLQLLVGVQEEAGVFSVELLFGLVFSTWTCKSRIVRAILASG